MRHTLRLLLGMLLLTGAASVGAALVPSPGQLDFRYQAVFTTSDPKATTLTNTGNQALSVVSVTQASGVYARAGGTCGAAPFTIAAQASCTIAHTFTPSRVDLFYQTLTVTLAGGERVDFGLAGEGSEGYLEITPPSLWFSSTPVGTIGIEQSANLFNNRPVPMQILQIGSTSVPGAAAFVRSGGTCPQPPFQQGAYASCTLAYTFAPTEVGNVWMTVDIMASSGTFVLHLSGDGAPEISLFGDGFETPALAPIQ
jgi:hypothetical protein